MPPLCTFYAYCLMSNHVHLLLRVNQEDIGSTIKHLTVMYAMYYNQKNAGMRQLSRLTGVTYGVINRLRGRM